MGKRTSLIVDPALMKEAATVLGTRGPTATVRAALERTVRQERLDRLARLELPEDFMDQLKRMREPRKFDFD
jgi:Arc/MetJ family transcription regulator